MYFFGEKSLLNKKIKLKVKHGRKTKERKAMVIYDDHKLIVVQYLGLNWREGFNHGDFADGTVRVIGGEAC